MTQFITRSLLFTRSFCSALTRSDSESWTSLEGLLRCSANDLPLSPLRFLERSSKAYSDDTSLTYGSLTFTWAQTHQRCLKLASSLAHHLRISRGDVVATFSYNLPEMYELHFAVPMAGAILCTLNARQDAYMVSALLRHSQAKALFVEPELLNIARAALDLLSTAPPALVLLGPAPPPAHEPKTFHYETLVRIGSDAFEIRLPLSEWDPISINYTSGTTSRPKAVVYSHRGAYLNSLATVLLHNMAARSVYLWTVPMFHCNGWCLPWGTAAQGAKSVCIRKPTPKAIFDSIAHHGVTHMGGVPTLLISIVNSRPEDRRPLACGGVEVLTGGSAPAPRVLAEMEAMGFRVNHIYGLTETLGAATNCVWKTEWDALGPEERYKMKAKQGVAHLGLAEVDVWDPQTMSPVEADGRTMGEVVFRGNTVMSGYFKDQRATEEAFKGGWFWTGDLAVKHRDGYIEIKDRVKDVVISGGENISTMEVEAVLYSHDAVLEAAVVGLPDPHWGETPCAFVDLKEGFEDTVRGDDIIEFCRARLPGYMVPRRVIFGELPKNSTGKIQKFVLRALAKSLGGV